MHIKRTLLWRRNLLLIPLALVLVVLLAGCGYDTGTPSMPAQQPSQVVTKETDFGAGNFIRDGLISALESFARLMGFMGVGVLKWFIGTIEGFNLTREGSYRQCQATFDAANPIDPLAGCAIQVYDSFKYLPMAVLGVALLYFLLKYTFQGLFRSGQLSLTDFLNNVLITTVIAFNLDFLVTMLVDISSKLFLLILSSSGTNPVNFGEGIFAQLKDMGQQIAVVGFVLLALLAGVQIIFGGFNSLWQAQGREILRYGSIGLLGITTLSVTIPALLEVMNLASGSTPVVGGGGATPVESMDTQLNNLLKLFDLNQNLHHNDLGALFVMVLLTVPAMFAFLVIGIFFFIRVLLFLLFFLMGVPAVAARLTSETAFFFEAWWRGLIKLAATSLPIAIILRIAIEVAKNISVSGDNLIQYIVLMLIITFLFGAGGVYAVWIMRSEVRTAVSNGAALKQGVGQLKERYVAGGNTTPRTASAGSGVRPANTSRQTSSQRPATQTQSSGSSAFQAQQRPSSTIPMTAQVMTQAISTGMTQAFQRQQATNDRAVGGILSQLSGLRVAVDEIRGQMRQLRQTNQTQEVETLLKALLEETRRKGQSTGSNQSLEKVLRELLEETRRKRTAATPFPAGGTTSGVRSLQTVEEGTTYHTPPGRNQRRRSAVRPLSPPSPAAEGTEASPLTVVARPANRPVAAGERARATRPVTPLAGQMTTAPVSVRERGAVTQVNVTTVSETQAAPASPTATLPPPPPFQESRRPVYLPSERAWRRPDGGRSTSARATGTERTRNVSASMVINPNTGMPYSGQGKRLKHQKAVNS